MKKKRSINMLGMPYTVKKFLRSVGYEQSERVRDGFGGTDPNKVKRVVKKKIKVTYDKRKRGKGL